MTLLAKGMGNKEISVAMHISLGTTRLYVSRLLKEFKLTNRWELAIVELRRQVVLWSTRHSQEVPGSACDELNEILGIRKASERWLS